MRLYIHFIGTFHGYINLLVRLLSHDGFAILARLEVADEQYLTPKNTISVHYVTALCDF